jgi:hypothetical protein
MLGHFSFLFDIWPSGCLPHCHQDDSLLNTWPPGCLADFSPSQFLFGTWDAWILCHQANLLFDTWACGCLVTLIFYLTPGHLDAWPLWHQKNHLVALHLAPWMLDLFITQPFFYLTPDHLDTSPLCHEASLILDTWPPGCLAFLSPSQFFT